MYNIKFLIYINFYYASSFALVRYILVYARIVFSIQCLLTHLTAFPQIQNIQNGSEIHSIR